MVDQNSNGGAEPGAATPRFSVLAQYIKDFSFENPNAPRTESAMICRANGNNSLGPSIITNGWTCSAGIFSSRNTPA